MGGPKNIPESVRHRLLNVAKAQQVDFNHVLVRYAIERLLYRLSVSEHSERFFLKGAMLLVLWGGQPYRPTMDVDLLGHGDSSAAAILAVFEDILAIPCEDDGLVFLPESISVGPIKEGQEYEGVRVSFGCNLAGAKIPVQVDIGFGDAVTPAPVLESFPALLSADGPKILTYPRETVIAEKFQSIVSLGMANTRMKDFSDLYYLLTTFTFDRKNLTAAIKATFGRRNTQLPTVVPVALTAEFHQNTDKLNQWKGFMRKSKLADRFPQLEQVCDEIALWLMPLLLVATDQG